MWAKISLLVGAVYAAWQCFIRATWKLGRERQMERVTSVEVLCELAIKLCERSAEIHREYEWIWLRNPVLVRYSARLQGVCKQLHEESVLYLGQQKV